MSRRSMTPARRSTTNTQATTTTTTPEHSLDTKIPVPPPTTLRKKLSKLSATADSPTTTTHNIISPILLATSFLLSAFAVLLSLWTYTAMISTTSVSTEEAMTAATHQVNVRLTQFHESLHQTVESIQSHTIQFQDMESRMKKFESRTNTRLEEVVSHISTTTTRLDGVTLQEDVQIVKDMIESVETYLAGRAGDLEHSTHVLAKRLDNLTTVLTRLRSDLVTINATSCSVTTATTVSPPQTTTTTSAVALPQLQTHIDMASLSNGGSIDVQSTSPTFFDWAGLVQESNSWQHWFKTKIASLVTPIGPDRVLSDSSSFPCWPCALPCRVGINLARPTSLVAIKVESRIPMPKSPLQVSLHIADQQTIHTSSPNSVIWLDAPIPSIQHVEFEIISAQDGGQTVCVDRLRVLTHEVQSM